MNYQERLKRLQAAMTRVPCDALVVEDKIDLYYLTGLELSAGKLLVHVRGAALFVDSRYLEVCQKQSPFPVVLSHANDLEEILLAPELSFVHVLAFDSATSYKSYQELVKVANVLVAKSKFSLVPVDDLVKSVRAIKEPSEIDLLRKAATLGTKGFYFVSQILKEGISEEEVAKELEIFWRQNGGKRLGFDPIIAFGSNSSMPHHRAGPSKLRKGDVVLVDIGVNYCHYHSDMTRIIFFGSVDSRIEEIYSIVLQAQQAALALCAPGMTVGAVDRAARDFIADHGHGAHFTHGLGHGVGLEIHELPVIKNIPTYYGTVLEPGMVITIEPGIYLSGIGGIRIEDTIVITENGYENLTQCDSSPVCL